MKGFMNSRLASAIALGAFFFVLVGVFFAESRIPLFSVEAVIKADANEDCSFMSHDEHISLRQLLRDYDRCFSYHLTVRGWLLAILLIGIAPFGAAWFITGRWQRQLLKQTDQQSTR